MNEIATVMDNPVNKKEFRKNMVATLVTLVFIMIYVLIRIQNWNATTMAVALIAMTIGPLVPFYIGWDRDYFRRPFKVEIRDDGMLCDLRYRRKAKFIPWDQVVSIGVHPVAPGKQPDRYTLDGPMWFKGEGKRKKKKQYILHRSIAIAAREKYCEVMGKYPPMFYWEQTDTVQYA